MPVVVTRDRDGDDPRRSSTAAPTAACSSATSRPATRRRSRARTTSGRTRSTAGCSACRSRRASAATAACPTDFDNAEHGLETLAVDRAPRRGVRLVRPATCRRSRTTSATTKLGWFDRVFDGRELARARLPAPAVPGQLEADVREHQGPVPRQPAARVPGDVRAVPRRQPVEDADGPDRPALRARVAAGRAARRSSAPTTSPGSSTTSRCATRACSIPVREFAGEATVVMQTMWPNLIVQQQSNTLAMRQLVHAVGTAVRAALDLLRLRRRRRGDAAAPPAPGEPDGPGRARVDRRQRGDAARPARRRGRARPRRRWSRWAGTTPPTPSTW